MPIFGVHVPHRKHTASCHPERMPIPKTVVIPMAMHIGAPCKPVVNVGDTVGVGQLIGEAGGFVSAPIHSSVSGTVKKIDTIPGGNGSPMTAITIEECPFNLFLPNTITPWLEDGKNDFFYLSGDLDYIQEMEINIYDRWGKLAYRSTDKNFRWDGKVDGRWLPNNTFTYKLQIVTILSKKYVYKGHINVL